jgi:hypothetical protein
MKNNRKNDTYSSSAWPTETKSAWQAEEPHVPEPVAADDQDVAPEGYLRYRAIYEFFARNSDEITFQPGDIVMVRILDCHGEFVCVKLSLNCRFRWCKPERWVGWLVR